MSQIGQHFITQIKVKNHVQEMPIYRRKSIKTSQNESVTSVTTLLRQILSIEEKKCGASWLPCLHFYLHQSFTI